MTSGLKRGIVAGVCALGATVATITPANAATAGAAYDCGTAGTIAFTFTRTAPPGKNLTVRAFPGFVVPTSIPVGGAVGTLIGPPSPPYPLTVTNPTAIPAFVPLNLTLTGVSPANLTAPPTAITVPAVSLGCGLIGTTSGTWPI